MVLRTSQPRRRGDPSKTAHWRNLASRKWGLAPVSSLGSATGQEQPREMVASVTAAVDPEGTAAGGSTQLTASYSKFSGKLLRAATLKAATLGMTHWLACSLWSLGNELSDIRAMFTVDLCVPAPHMAYIRSLTNARIIGQANPPPLQGSCFHYKRWSWAEETRKKFKS